MRHSVRVEAIVLDIADNADHRHPRSVRLLAAQLDALAHGSFARPEASGRCSIHHPYEVRAELIESGEGAAFDDRRAESAEVVGRHRDVLGHGCFARPREATMRSEEHTSELQSLAYLVC